MRILKQNISQKNKKKNVGKFIILFIVTGIIISSTAVKEGLLVFLNNKDKTIEVYKEIDFMWSDNEIIKTYKNSIVKYENNSIISYDFEGKEIWKKSIRYEKPIIYIGSQYIYIGDRNTGEISVLNEYGQTVWKYNSMKPINHMIEQQDYLIIFTESDDNTEMISVINRKGEPINSTTIRKGIPMFANISDNQDLIVSALDISQNAINSVLLLYTMDGELIWNREFENQLIKYVDFVDEYIIVVTDNKLSLISRNNNLLWSRDIKGTLKDIKIDEEGKSIITLLDNKGSYLESISLQGRTKNKTKLDGQADRIYIYKDNVFLIGTNEIIGIDNNNIFLKYVNNETIKSFCIYDNKALIFTSQKIRKGSIVNSYNSEGR